MTKRALVLLHQGFEEIEAITPMDLLTRAKVEVTQAYLGESPVVTGRNGITLNAEKPLHEASSKEFDLIVLPGGPGILQLRGDEAICRLLRQQVESGRTIGCICAAPLLLLDAGLLTDGMKYTAHCSTLDELPHAEKDTVVIDGPIITSTGAGTSTEFSLELVRQIVGDSIAKEIAGAIAWRHPF